MKREVTAEVFQYGYNTSTIRCRYSRRFRSVKMAYITVRIVAWLMDKLDIIPYPLGIFYMVYRNPIHFKHRFQIEREKVKQ